MCRMDIYLHFDIICLDCMQAFAQREARALADMVRWRKLCYKDTHSYATLLSYDICYGYHLALIICNAYI